MAPKRILVTGGLGLIGHNVVRRLLDQDHEVSITDTRTNYGLVPQEELDYLMAERVKKIPEVYLQTHRVDIADRDGIDWMMRRYQPNIVIHLASFPRQKVVNINPQIGSRAMSEGLLNLLENSVQHHVEKFIYISSSMVYGDFQDDVREDAECRPQGQYGIMKLAGEWLVRDYTRKYGMAHTIIRPSAVYGPLDVEDRVISKFLLTAMRDETIKVNGATETLDFTYVDDAADGIVAALRDQANNRTYNITKSHSKTLLEAATLAVQIVGQGSIECRDRDQDFPSRGALNIDAARRDLDFNPRVDIEEGFDRYHDWLKNSTFWKQKINDALNQRV
jgi:nucleoside-diphosphate-sugar epimerase